MVILGEKVIKKLETNEEITSGEDKLAAGMCKVIYHEMNED